MTYREIAQVLGVSHVTVMDIERRALLKMRKILLSKGYSEDYL